LCAADWCDQVWIGVGILGGIGVYKLVSTLMSTPPPR